MDTARMRTCAALLPEPGGEVVAQCADEIDRLRAENERLREALELVHFMLEWDADRDQWVMNRSFTISAIEVALRGGEG